MPKAGRLRASEGPAWTSSAGVTGEQCPHCGQTYQRPIAVLMTLPPARGETFQSSIPYARRQAGSTQVSHATRGGRDGPAARQPFAAVRRRDSCVERLQRNQAVAHRRVGWPSARSLGARHVQYSPPPNLQHESLAFGNATDTLAGVQSPVAHGDYPYGNLRLACPQRRGKVV